MRKRRAKRALSDRFWPKVNRNGANGCWLWTGAIRNDGYGAIHLGERRMARAHRVSFMLAFGELPAAPLEVCHRCDVRACVNPAHLFLGTRKDNMADCKAKDRQVRGERNGKSKLTDPEVIAIRTAAGTHKAIAQQFAISRSMVTFIRTNKNWTHLEN